MLVLRLNNIMMTICRAAGRVLWRRIFYLVRDTIVVGEIVHMLATTKNRQH